ncbi:MAG: hypothetical protein ACFCUU_14840 [Cyclobacteriaceae bacterium]
MKALTVVFIMILSMIESHFFDHSWSQQGKKPIKVRNTAFLNIDNQVIFKGNISMHAIVSNYSNQILFTLMDDEGQNVTITFAGKDISKRKPTELTFNSPGLFHGYSEAQDVFFITFARLEADREPGQLKYERHWPQHIMEGKLSVVSWTDSSFEMKFEGKLGNDNQVNSPDSWLPFSGTIRAGSYQLYTN